jgi:hypothetical protein
MLVPEPVRQKELRRTVPRRLSLFCLGTLHKMN